MIYFQQKLQMPSGPGEHQFCIYLTDDSMPESSMLSFSKISMTSHTIRTDDSQMASTLCKVDVLQMSVHGPLISSNSKSFAESGNTFDKEFLIFSQPLIRVTHSGRHYSSDDIGDVASDLFAYFVFLPEPNR